MLKQFNQSCLKLGNIAQNQFFQYYAQNSKSVLQNTSREAYFGKHFKKYLQSRIYCKWTSVTVLKRVSLSKKFHYFDQ